MNLLKKTILAVAAIAAVALIPAKADAQVRFGIKAGTIINKIKLDNFGQTFDSNNRAGFTGGVMGEFTVPIVGIGADVSLMYSHMSGQVLEGTQVEEPSKNFFQIPINLKYKFTIPAVNNIVSPFIYTGPDFAFKLGGDDDVIKTKTFQFAWNVGIGVELIRHLQLSGGYSFGCNNILDFSGLAGGSNLSSDIKAKNSYWTITAAYLF